MSKTDMRQSDQRCLPELRAHIGNLLAKGWVISERTPLTLRSGRKTYQVLHGMLISEAAR
jgi:hypothetical protein